MAEGDHMKIDLGAVPTTAVAHLERGWSIRDIHWTYVKALPELAMETCISASDSHTVLACHVPPSCDITEECGIHRQDYVDDDPGPEISQAAFHSGERSTIAIDQPSLHSEHASKALGHKSRIITSSKYCKKKVRRARAVYDLFIYNLTYKVMVRRSGKEIRQETLLDNVTAKASNCEILAIIERSGSSKKTLLDALAGRIDRRNLQGSLLVNGVEFGNGLKSISGYYQLQGDALFPMLTTRETLMFSALLGLPLKITACHKRERVEALMEDLGLSSCSGTRVGDEKSRGISPGERRRLSIGVDIIHDPPVIFLDEPTSALDSTSALQVMEILGRLALKRKHTIVLTIHDQPSFRILDTLHNAVLLMKGTVVYHGPPSGIVDHFNSLGRPIPHHVNVVEYALDIVAEFERKPEGLQPLIALQKDTENLLKLQERIHRNSTHRHPRSMRRRRNYATSFSSELLVLSLRNFYNSFRTRSLFSTQVVVTVLTSMILITLFHKSPVSEKGVQQRQAFTVFTLAVLVFTSAGAVPMLLLERKIFLRERSRGAYRTSSYAVAHSVAALPFLLFQATLFSCLTYFAVGLVAKASALFFFISVIFLVLCVANALVASVSAIAPDCSIALVVVGSVYASMFLISDYFMNKDTVPAYWLWLHYLSVFKYSYEAVVGNELENMAGTVWFEDLDSDAIMRKLVGAHVDRALSAVAMMLLALGYRVIFYLALRVRTRKWDYSRGFLKGKPLRTCCPGMCVSVGR